MERWVNSYKDVIEFAIGHEIKAYQLYTELSKRMASPKTRELCKKLAKEERRHIARLEKESERKCQLISPIDFSKYDIPYGKVNIFANRLSMLSFAVKKEKAAVQLYRDLAALTRNEDARDLFMRLVQEELKHEQQVGREYNNCLK